jgi:hypothetical protein
MPRGHHHLRLISSANYQQTNNDFRFFSMITLATFGAFSMYTPAEAKPKEHNETDFFVKNQIKPEWLQGTSTKKVILQLYDSKNPVQCQFIDQMVSKQIYSRLTSKHPDVTMSQIDISSDPKNLSSLLDLGTISTEKISRKNRPTFLIISDGRISKMQP